MSTRACTRRSTVTLAANRHDTPTASRLPLTRPASSESANITTMPPNAAAIATHVRVGTVSRRNSRAASAARNGDTLISTKVLATVVRVSEAMNRKNWPARNAPDRSPGRPTARTAPPTCPRCMTNSVAATKIAMNSERQNTISQASRNDSIRTSSPPVDQQTAAATMNRIARERRAGSTRVATDMNSARAARDRREGLRRWERGDGNDDGRPRAATHGVPQPAVAHADGSHSTLWRWG